MREIRAVRLLRRSSPDIVHVHNSVRLLFSALVYRLLRSSVRVVFTFHTQPITRRFIEGLNLPEKDYGAVAAMVARALLRNADLITSVSDSIIARHNAAYNLGIARHVRIPSGGDPAVASTPSNGNPIDVQGRPLLMSVGVMTWDWKEIGRAHV